MISARVRIGFLLVLVLSAGSAHGQSVHLTLQKSAKAPGSTAYEGLPLSGGTDLVVLRQARDNAHTLSNVGCESRVELVQALRYAAPSEISTDHVVGGGQTESRYERTRGQIYYILARTPDGELFESYVASDYGMVPGFDTVFSGKMSMGPVPEGARKTMQEVFENIDIENLSEVPIHSDAKQPSARENRGSVAGTGFGSVDSRKSVVSGSLASNDLADTKDPEEETGVFWLFVVGLTAFMFGAYLMHKLLPSEADKWREKYQTRREVKQTEKRQRAGFSRNQDVNVASKSEKSLESKLADLKQQLEDNDLALHIQQAQTETLRAESQESKKRIQDLRAKLSSARSEIERLQRSATDSGSEGSKQESVAPPNGRSAKFTKGQPPDMRRKSTRETEVSTSSSTVSVSCGEGDSTRAGAAHCSEIGKAYAAWCSEGGRMVDRYYMFARKLQGVIDGIQVKPVYAQRQDHTHFGAEAEGDEYWLVEAHGTAYVLPVPRQRDLQVSGVVFDGGSTALEDVDHVRPAHVVPDGRGYRLESKGALKPVPASG